MVFSRLLSSTSNFRLIYTHLGYTNSTLDVKKKQNLYPPKKLFRFFFSLSLSSVQFVFSFLYFCSFWSM